MNRFIIQVSFQTKEELEEAKRKLIEIGVDKKDIALIPSPIKQKSDLQAKVVLTYILLGCTLYFVLLTLISQDSIVHTIKKANILHLILTIVFVSFFRIPVRYLLSKAKLIKEKRNEKTTIAVVTPYEKVNVIKRNLEEFETEDIQIVDDLKNVEAGIRD